MDHSAHLRAVLSAPSAAQSFPGPELNQNLPSCYQTHPKPHPRVRITRYHIRHSTEVVDLRRLSHQFQPINLCFFVFCRADCVITWAFSSLRSIISEGSVAAVCQKRRLSLPFRCQYVGHPSTADMTHPCV